MINGPGLYQQGWVCPKCGREYSPLTTMCVHCANASELSYQTTSSRSSVDAALDVLGRLFDKVEQQENADRIAFEAEKREVFEKAEKDFEERRKKLRK